MIHMPESPNMKQEIVPKLIDFGLSTVLMQGDSSTELYGTLAYCSPEIFLGFPYN